MKKSIDYITYTCFTSFIEKLNRGYTFQDRNVHQINIFYLNCLLHSIFIFTSFRIDVNNHFQTCIILRKTILKANELLTQFSLNFKIIKTYRQSKFIIMFLNFNFVKVSMQKSVFPEGGCQQFICR